jgi:hypothetical protein
VLLQLPLRHPGRRLAKQLTRLNVQHIGHTREREQRRIGLGGFDLLPVAPVHLGTARGLFEREGRRGAPRTYIGTKSMAEDGLGDGQVEHAPGMAHT